MMKEKFDFEEQEYEYIEGKKVPVTITSKYKSTKEKVISLLKDEKYKDILAPSDFWILKTFNRDKTACFYNGLIISHEALIKINDSLGENLQFNQAYCSDPIPTNWKGIEGYRMEYRDKRDGMFEYGEISTYNCKNDYPFAMLLKRVFDRVVKRKAKLSMVYSDSEADEFKEPVEKKQEPKATSEQVELIYKYKDVILDELMARDINGVDALTKISIVEASKLCELINERLGKEDD